MYERELPKYKSHKIVWALKIAKLIFDIDLARDESRETDGSATLYFDEEGYSPLKVNHEYVRKHDPKVGGYYVQYEDGYKSWSPADVFESGYSKIVDDESHETEIQDFGWAIRKLKQGKKVQRIGWNGKGMFLFLLPAGTIPKTAIHDPALKAVLDNNGKDHFEALGSIRMKTADDKILTGWLASQTDILADDWTEV